MRAPVAGARDLFILNGIHHPPKPIFTVPQETAVLAAAEHLAASGRVYAYGNSVMLDAGSYGGGGRHLRPLATGGLVENGVEATLANLFTCADGDVLFPPPRWFVHVLLQSELLRPRLPRVTHYATRVVFGRDYVLRGPGWHPEEGVLVHGDAVEPDVPADADPSAPALDRLPPHLRTLLAGFCFRGDADVAGALAMCLHGLLANHFVTRQRPIFLVDGNQPNLGKTLLVRAAGGLLDGDEPALIPWTTNEEELEKKLCALLRSGPRSVVLLDNAKSVGGSPINSPILEGYVAAPILALRILGKSAIYSRPNDLVWGLTMNGTQVSPDLTSRGVPVRLWYEGKPQSRAFGGPNPVEFAVAHRRELLAELAGMVVKWTRAGRPAGGQKHRCQEWAAVVGGVLSVAGFPEFLSNYGEAAASFNTQLEDLSALAEAVVKNGGPSVEAASFEGGSP